MKTIHIIGAGGIGSFLVRSLVDLRDNGQLVQLETSIPYTDIIVYDDDMVEQKNVSYQNYTEEDCFNDKALTLEERYKIKSKTLRVENISDIVTSPEDIVISCVDNVKLRRHLYQWQTENDNHWIDLRSHARVVGWFIRHPKNTLEKLLTTLPEKDDENSSGSCQNAHDLSEGIIQNGNKVIAELGAQKVLNYLRGYTDLPGTIFKV